MTQDDTPETPTMAQRLIAAAETDRTALASMQKDLERFKGQATGQTFAELESSIGAVDNLRARLDLLIKTAAPDEFISNEDKAEE